MEASKSEELTSKALEQAVSCVENVLADVQSSLLPNIEKADQSNDSSSDISKLTSGSDGSDFEIIGVEHSTIELESSKSPKEQSEDLSTGSDAPELEVVGKEKPPNEEDVSENVTEVETIAIRHQRESFEEIIDLNEDEKEKSKEEQILEPKETSDIQTEAVDVQISVIEILDGQLETVPTMKQEESAINVQQKVDFGSEEVEETVEEITRDSVEKAINESAEKVTEDPVLKEAQELVNKIAEDSDLNIIEESDEKVVEDSVPKDVEESAKKITEGPVSKEILKTIQESAERLKEDPDPKRTEVSLEENTENYVPKTEEVSVEEVAEDSIMKVIVESMEKATEDSDLKKVEESVEKVEEDLILKVVDETEGKGTEDPASGIVEESVVEIAEGYTSKAIKESAEKVTEKPSPKMIEESGKKGTEDLNSERVEESVQKAAEISVPRTIEDQVEKTMKESEPKKVEESVLEIEEDSVQKTMKESVIAEDHVTKEMETISKEDDAFESSEDGNIASKVTKENKDEAVDLNGAAREKLDEEEILKVKETIDIQAEAAHVQPSVIETSDGILETVSQVQQEDSIKDEEDLVPKKIEEIVEKIAEDSVPAVIEESLVNKDLVEETEKKITEEQVQESVVETAKDSVSRNTEASLQVIVEDETIQKEVETVISSPEATLDISEQNVVLSQAVDENESESLILESKNAKEEEAKDNLSTEENVFNDGQLTVAASTKNLSGTEEFNENPLDEIVEPIIKSSEKVEISQLVEVQVDHNKSSEENSEPLEIEEVRAVSIDFKDEFEEKVNEVLEKSAPIEVAAKNTSDISHQNVALSETIDKYECESLNLESNSANDEEASDNFATEQDVLPVNQHTVTTLSRHLSGAEEFTHDDPNEIVEPAFKSSEKVEIIEPVEVQVDHTEESPSSTFMTELPEPEKEAFEVRKETLNEPPEHFEVKSEYRLTQTHGIRIGISVLVLLIALLWMWIL